MPSETPGMIYFSQPRFTPDAVVLILIVLYTLSPGAGSGTQPRWATKLMSTESKEPAAAAAGGDGRLQINPSGAGRRGYRREG